MSRKNPARSRFQIQRKKKVLQRMRTQELRVSLAAKPIEPAAASLAGAETKPIVVVAACGVPVAAYPVVGPIDVVTEPGIGCLDADLAHAIDVALRDGDPAACVRHASQFTWERCTDQLLAGFVPVR